MTRQQREDLIKRYEALETGLVADAMDDLGLACGAVPGLFLCAGGKKPAAGFAVTMRQAKRTGPYDGVPKARHAQVIDGILESGDMLVIETGGIADVTTGGGLLALRAKMKGAAGFVTDGSLRDLDEIEDMQFPVCCAGRSPLRSLERLETISVNEEISLRGVRIRPGDVILMDTSGLVAVPAAEAERVADRAAKIRKEESAVESYIRKGLTIAQSRTRAKKDMDEAAGE